MHRPRLVLVHGSLVGGRATWREQRQGIGDAVELVVLERPGFDDEGPGGGDAPPRVDFDDHAVWLADRLTDGDHLVGHSYGGVVTLLAAAHATGIGSLTVIEPPATRVALDVPGNGHRKR